MINEPSHRKIADGIRARSMKTSLKKEELVVHSYAPAADASPDSSDRADPQHLVEQEPLITAPEDSSAGFAPRLSSPKKRNRGQNPADGNPTLSERIVLAHVSARHYALRGMIIGMILIIGGGIAISTVFARATVRIKPRIEIATIQNVSVIFDRSVSQPVPEQKIIPVEHLRFTETRTQEIGASGTQYIEAHSRGTVRISNHYSTAPQRLVARTRFLTPSGALFRLANPIVIPGAVVEKGKLAPRSIDVELVADVPGEQANLSGSVSLKIAGFIGTPKYDGFTAVASNGFSGGSRGMKKIASDADVRAAQEQVTKKVYDELKQQMRQKIPPGLRLIDGLQEIRIVKVETIEAGEKLMTRAIAEGDALVFHEDDAAALLKNALLPQDDTKAFIDGSLNLTYAVRTLNFERGRADALIQGSVKTKQLLTQTQAEELARALSGKKQGSVREFFNSRSDVVLSSVSIFPPWRSALPSHAERIRIVEEETER